jgi:myo-inositol-1(or 4)-monophosphatase
LAGLLPGAQFFAEESGARGDGDAPYCWVIDPLDGTTNFAHGLPYFCISVALTYQGTPVFGMVYQPLTRELMHAQTGHGAWLNGERIRTSSLPFEQAVIALGLPYIKRQEYDELVSKGREIARQAYAVRHMGAVALDLAYVACGRLEGSILRKLGWWDIAAGVVLVSEAGGAVSDLEGRSVNADYTSCIASNTLDVHQKLLDLLK